jgi:hypothetical protein
MNATDFNYYVPTAVQTESTVFLFGANEFVLFILPLVCGFFYIFFSINKEKETKRYAYYRYATYAYVVVFLIYMTIKYLVISQYGTGTFYP